MLLVPILRAGEPYRSLRTFELPDVRDGQPVARVSEANSGLISRDMRDAPARQQPLIDMSVHDLVRLCAEAATIYVEDELPIDPIDGVMQSPEDYVASLSATTGLPRSLVRLNMEKTRFVLAEMETVLAGLTRALDLDALDRGWVEHDGRPVAYVAQATALGGVLPGNSPGVHSLWLPAIALKVPVVLKPGRAEPWTPMRVAQAMMRAGIPREAFGLYPTDHAGAQTILTRADRAMIFGDESTVRPWMRDPRIQIHGPGWSKILIGADRAPQ